VSVYSYLGPAGTFTEAALIPLLKPEDKSVPAVNVTAALDAVRSGTADYAIVHIENSVEGVVARTLDELASGEPLLIIGESILSVSFALMVKPGVKISEIKRLATHPHAEAQCREYIAKNIPGAEVIMTASTAAGAEAVAKGDETVSRIGADKREDDYVVLISLVAVYCRHDNLREWSRVELPSDGAFGIYSPIICPSDH